jgi:hypothetical protein
MAAYPLCLGRIGGQEGEDFGPECACAGDVARGFALLRLGGERVDLLCVDQGVAARTGACAAWEGSAAGGAVCGSRHDGWTRPRGCWCVRVAWAVPFEM